MTSAIANNQRGVRRVGALALAASLFFGGRTAEAQASPADKAAAQALFDQAKGLVKGGRVADACPKFAESQRLDPGLGTMLYLADCYEKNGQTASAWIEFLGAAAAAKAAGQPEREKRARDRAAALEPKLLRVSVEVAPAAEVAGLEVRRDGTLIAKPLWGTPVALDRGAHVVEATAPGKKKWSSTVTLRAGDPMPLLVVVPVLEDVPVAPAAVAATPVVPPGDAPSNEPPKPQPITSGAAKPVAKQPALAKRPPPRTSPARVVGYVATAVGATGAGVGGIIGLVATMKNSDSAAHCKPNNVCNALGEAERASALDLANVTTGTMIAGAVVFTTGLVLLLATSDPDEAVTGLRVKPLVALGHGGLSIEGTW